MGRRSNLDREGDVTVTPGQPVYINHGLRDPRCQEIQPTMPGTVELTDYLMLYVRGEDGVLYAFRHDRAARLALVATRKPREEA
jgi:hypothetical protein